MHSNALVFVQDLAVIMLVAGLISVLCHRFRQPVVLGYILAGIIVGPHTPPVSFIIDINTIQTLAELGVIFLMFSLGMEFNLRKLSKVGKPASIATLLEIIAMTGLGYWVGRLFNWSETDAIFLGAMLAISSTTIILKALEELNMKHKKFAQLIFGILILEDVFAIAILALLSTISITGSMHAEDFIITLGKLSTFLVVSLFLGILLIPRLLSYIAKFNSREILLISVLGICFGFCLLVIKLGYSVALGAFIIGAIIAESRQLGAIEALIMPLRDMFSAIFFVSVGLMFDPQVLLTHTWPIIGITLIVVVGKVVSSGLGVLITGKSGKMSMRVGLGLAQIGEFSFIIATLGVTLGVTSSFLYPIAVTVSAITTLLTPYLIKYSDSFTHIVSLFIPESISKGFEHYKGWINARHSTQNQQLRLYKLYHLVQVIVNLFIIMGIFFAMAYIAGTPWGDFISSHTNHHIQKAIFWALALIISLPFIIAAYRKIQFLCLLLTELNIKEDKADLNLKWHKIVAELIPIFSLISMMLFVCALSFSILPPIELLIIICFVGLFLMVLLYNWFIKLHSRLKDIFLDTFEKNKHDKS
ncbi:MAG: cation:proton antiporter [Candidatus Berkiella sp.]